MERYLIKFTKESNIKFISHLDLMRTMRKIIRRAGLSINYSKGFNPHMALSLAQPLSVGVYSEGEYMDLILEAELDGKEIISRLNEKSAPGIKFIEAKRIINIENEKKLPQAMALIDACRYIIKIKYTNVSILEEEIKNLQKEATWNTIKKSKKTEREIDIKSMLYDFEYQISDNELELNILIQSGSKEHLSANTFIDYLKEKTSNVNEDAFVDIKRTEMYFLKDGEYIPLYSCN